MFVRHTVEQYERFYAAMTHSRSQCALLFSAELHCAVLRRGSPVLCLLWYLACNVM